MSNELIISEDFEGIRITLNLGCVIPDVLQNGHAWAAPGKNVWILFSNNFVGVN